MNPPFPSLKFSAFACCCCRSGSAAILNIAIANTDTIKTMLIRGMFVFIRNYELGNVIYNLSNQSIDSPIN